MPSESRRFSSPIPSHPHSFLASCISGCYIVAIRPRIEGRFFQKEYIFDKPNKEGGVLRRLNHEEVPTLNYVREVMNETEYVQ